MRVRVGRLPIVVATVVLAVLAATACGLDIIGLSSPDDKNADGVETGVVDALSPFDVGGGGANADGSTSPGDGSLDTGDAEPCALDGGASGGSGIVCNGSCIDPWKDRANCGGCTNVCQAWAACEGKCVDVAASLVGFRHELPCTNDASPACSIAVAIPPNKVATLTGTSGRTYMIDIRFRGVLEQRTYAGDPNGGATGQNANFFSFGGTGTGGDNWNIYDMRISAPDFTWHLNSGTSGNTFSDPLDYTAAVQANAGATLALHADSGDTAQAKNRTASGEAIIIPGIPPAPLDFKGQFVQLDVVRVRALP